MNFLAHFYALFLESAPWLLFGLFVAGILKVFIPMSWMNKQLGGHDLKTTIKAAFIGAPLPLCSCGVIPAAIGLRHAGASKAATTSFLVSTPETGIDSISVSYVLLGPFMTVARPIAAIFSAIVAGLLVGQDDQENKEAPKKAHDSLAAKTKINKSHCCTATFNKEPVSVPQKESTSCCVKNTPQKPVLNVFKKLRQGLIYSSTNLINDITIWLLIGLSFAALIQTYLPDGFFAQWGNGVLAMLAMILISIPMYICATASTPIAAGLLLAGVSPGAILVFMLAGPATNVATLGVVSKQLGKKALVSYLTGVIGGAVLSGYLVDVMVTQFDIRIVPQIGHEHALLPMWLTLSTAIILAILMTRSVIQKIIKQSR